MTTWRKAVQADWPAIVRLQGLMALRFNEWWDLPRFSPMVDYYVAEREGVIVEAAYIERIAELCLVGLDREATEELVREASGLEWLMREAGLRFLRCMVPRRWARAIGRYLNDAGLEEQPGLTTFLLDMRR